MNNPEHDRDNEITETVCKFCDLVKPVDVAGFCDDCAAKLERDFIRARDWHSLGAEDVGEDELEALRERTIQEHGAAYEFMDDPYAAYNSKRKRHIAKNLMQEYDVEAVIELIRDFIREQPADWVDLGDVSRYLYDLESKPLGTKANAYTVLLRQIADDSDDFEVRQDGIGNDRCWVRMKSV